MSVEHTLNPNVNRSLLGTTSRPPLNPSPSITSNSQVSPMIHKNQQEVVEAVDQIDNLFDNTARDYL